jgi:hypothetical protein
LEVRLFIRQRLSSGEILQPGGQGKRSRHHPEIPEDAQNGQDERPVQQRRKNKAIRIEAPAQDIEEAYTGNPHPRQAKIVHPLARERGNAQELRDEMRRHHAGRAFDQDDPPIDFHGLRRAPLTLRRQQAVLHLRDRDGVVMASTGGC